MKCDKDHLIALGWNEALDSLGNEVWTSLSQDFPCTRDYALFLSDRKGPDLVGNALEGLADNENESVVIPHAH